MGLHDVTRGIFMCRVSNGIQEAYRERLDARLVDKSSHVPDQLRLIDRHANRSVARDAFGNLDPAAARRHRLCIANA
jgi:hypothetical protein